ncbi:hypothetical protein [Trueperella pyogenes]|uniref:hypothetical protein n=1 Tax=Trueperella pyogenes TaxID=1661 RepID=UPI0014328A09|nr:hypothetical protein [Trueperella pyogenes]QIU87369.1 hypothetical protein HEP79_09195 [Trueperella pyogenes]
MARQVFRIHGDNIVECERVVAFLTGAATLSKVSTRMISSAVTEVDVDLEDTNGTKNQWRFQFFPGFNKAKRQRWNLDIFDALRLGGGFLDETPDAIVTKVSADGKEEKILCALEFCSALQAGNQAWQRSGRAFSTHRSGCPYLYIVDFVKYELDSNRTRKALRMPNPAVPYSYISTSQDSDTLCAQVFVRAEEFSEDDPALEGFDQAWFGEADLANYLLALLRGGDTSNFEKTIKEKNLKLVEFFAKELTNSKMFNANDWRAIYSGSSSLSEMTQQKAISWRKKFAKKSESSLTNEIVELCAKYAVAVGSNDLPFALVPQAKVSAFKHEFKKIISNVSKSELAEEIDANSDLVVCLVKGFKPRGDDARPDRGVLPLVSMLFGESTQVLTYIYGPMTKSRFDELIATPKTVAQKSGFWKVFLALSDLILVDSPEVRNESNYFCGIVGSPKVKKSFLSRASAQQLKISAINEAPNSVHEDDVDTVIHTLFSALDEELFFEGLCNPPGGDWSGLSLRVDDDEIRWLSLPRVSDNVGGKRPDHVIQLFPDGKDTFTLSVESKDKSKALETNVGPNLVQYLRYLANFAPSATRKKGTSWKLNKELRNLANSKIVSAAAFIAEGEDLQNVYKKTKCDVMFALRRVKNDTAWEVKVLNFGLDSETFGSLQSLLCNSKHVPGIEITWDEQAPS